MTLILDAVNVRVEYGDFVALPSLNLQLSAGDLLGFIGPNGAGKTTSLKAFAGLIPRAAGTISVLSDPVEAGNTVALSRVGFAPDTPPIYEDLTVADFLRFVGRAYRLQQNTVEERIDFWLEQLWLSDRRESKIKSLSRGMRQRVTVARTLLPDPTLILLDEPAAGLDPAGRVQFRKMLGSLRDQGKALIVSSHILADLHEYCTHIAIMEAGHLREFGTVAQVVGGQKDNRCRYNITLAHVVPDVERILRTFSSLTQIEVHGREITFEHEHDQQLAAKLLQDLIARDLPIASFAPIAHDLEEAYLRTGIRQVD